MLIAIAALALSGQLVTAVADRLDTVPNLPVEQSCRAQASRTSAIDNAGIGGTLQGCLNSEHAARDKLRTEWKDFAANTRGNCYVTSTMGGEPSYVELLTCLEMAKQAAELERRRVGTTGQAK
jgi:hypothetical protein